jgi:DNA-binding response OmpR family regulator
VVSTFTSSKDLLNATGFLVPDVILQDVRLSEQEDGKLICQEIKQILRYPNKIYLYSATRLEQKDVLKCCADGFIEKPCDIFSLVNTINQVLA